MLRMNAVAKTWMIRIFSAILVLCFVVWGIGDYANQQLNAPVATVNGSPISQNEFGRAYEEEYQRLRSMSGGALDKATAEKIGLKQQTLVTLVSRRLFLELAQELRLSVSPETLRRIIAANPAFRKDGRFDLATYEAELAKNNIDAKRYERGLESDLVTMQLEQALQATATLPEPLLREMFLLNNEERRVEVLALTPADLAGELKPTDQELQAHLQAHQNAFMTPLKVKLRYLMLDQESVRQEIKITEAEIKTYYDEHKASFEQPETRQVRHILAMSDGSPAQQEAAQARIAKAQARIAKGESFAAVAKELSEDVTAELGGELGPPFPRGTMVQPFEEAAFALPVGKVSPPVVTPFGLHLILVDAIHPATGKTLAEAEAEIRAQLTQEKAPELVYDRSEVVEDQLAISGDLAQVAKELDLRYRETDFISRNDPKRQGLETLAPFMDKAFATAKGETTPLFELPDARFAALQVTDRQEPRPQTLEEVREAVRQSWLQARGLTLARERLEAALKELQGGKGWDSVKQVKGGKVKDLGPFLRRGDKTPVPEAVRAVAFRLSQTAPLHPGVVESEQGLMLVRLKEIKTPDMARFAAQKVALAQTLEEQLGQEQYQAVMNGIGRRAKIEVNDEELKRF